MAGLGDYPAAAVLRAEDYKRAEKFYMDVVGLESGGMDIPGGGTMLKAGQGTMVLIYERPGIGAPESTALGFGVPMDKFDSIMAELRAKGVVFEEYDIPEMNLKTVNGVVEMEGLKSSWFKDTEGNIVNIATM